MIRNTNKRWHRFAHAYVAFSFRHPRILLTAALLVAAVFAFIAFFKIRVVTDLEALLPRGTASVRALSESRRRIGSTDFFVMAVQSASKDAQQTASLQDMLKSRVEAEWSDATWVQVDRDTAFFKDHALFFIDATKLEQLEQILNDEIVRISAEDMPGMVSLADTKPSGEEDIETRLSKWLNAEALADMGFPPQVEEALARFFKIDRTDAEAPTAPTPMIPEMLRDRLISEDGGVGVVLVQLDKPSTDFDYAKFALTRGASLIDNVLNQGNFKGMSAQVVGAYRSFTEVDQVSADGEIATAVSAGSVFLLLLLFFRSVQSTVSLLVPLTVSAASTMGLTALIFGRLTVFTVFVLALLAGMGIDYGIHLLGRVRAEYKRGLMPRYAVEAAVIDTGAALFTAAITTVGCLLVLLVGHFDGFKEFALIAALGVVLSLVSAICTVPALCALIYRTPAPIAQRRESRLAAHPERLRTWTARLFAAGLLATFGLSLFAPRVEFEHDFRNLRGPKTSKTIAYGGAIGKKAGTAPSIVLGESRAQMDAVHQFLLERLGKDPRLGSFITATTFVPSKSDQARRHAVIQRIGEIANKRALNRVKGEGAKWVEMLRDMCRADPFTERDIPEWTRKILTEKDGTFGAVGHFYAKINDWDANAILDYQDDYGTLAVEGKPVLMANSAFILSDVVRMVRADGARLLIASVAVLVLILGFFAKNFRGALVLTFSVGVGIVWTLGIMGLLRLRIGLYNLIVIPVILGVSIDTAVHLYHRHRSLGPLGLLENLRTTGVMTAASTWTTFAGFFGLLFVSHLGLRSIGILGCVGIFACWASTMMMMPFLLARIIPADTPIPDTRGLFSNGAVLGGAGVSKTLY